MGFGQGLSGLNAASQNLDVIGNNIANSGTVGYKSSSTSFADIYASSRVGLGVRVSAVNQDFSVGNVSSTGGQYDVAIDGSNGFFRLTDSSGSVFYSRNGQFNVDENFNLVNASNGMQVTGYPAGSIGAQPVPLKIPQANIPPQATTSATMLSNLDANATPITTAFNATDRTTYTDSVPTTVYDSLGNSHQLMQYFVKQAPDAVTGNSVYNIYYTLDGAAVTSPSPNATLQFDASGTLASASTVTVGIATVGSTTSPAQPMSIAINYNGTTQYGSDFSPKVTATGYASGDYNGVTIAKDGSVVANYSNGQTQIVGTIALARFNNPEGLQPAGNNVWTETPASGQATLGQPGTSGLATLQGQALEESNVNMSNELVNMIIAQRTYQANAQTIKTQDQILQTLMNMA